MTEEQMSIKNSIDKARRELPKGRLDTLEYLDWMLFIGGLSDVVSNCSDNHELVKDIKSLEFDIRVRGLSNLTPLNKYGISYMGFKG